MAAWKRGTTDEEKLLRKLWILFVLYDDLEERKEELGVMICLGKRKCK